ncbi:MAG: mismatch repair protein MutS [Bacteroidota bacterium]
MSSASAVAETPLMKQYNAIKAKYPDAVLLFRVGDFYETFGQDAVRAAQVLGIVLTKRKNGAAAYVELAGFPHHSLDSYLPKLVKAGLRVAICDQLEDPKMVKGIVKRGVTELVTPGVSYNEKTIDLKDHHFLAAIAEGKKEWGVAFVDISTGLFEVAQGSLDFVKKLLHVYQPKEVLFQKHRDEQFRSHFGDGFAIFKMDDWAFTNDFGKDQLNQHFKTQSLKGFGVDEMDMALAASGAIFQYLKDTQHDKLDHIQKVTKLDMGQLVGMDAFTVRNLELLYTPHGNGKALVDILDNTKNPMGARLLRRWLRTPLRDLSKIQSRLSQVRSWKNNAEQLEWAREELSELGDWERIAARVAVQKITPRELVQLSRSLSQVSKWKDAGDMAQTLFSSLKDLTPLANMLQNMLHEEAPHAIGKGYTIASGVNEELDELRGLQTSGKDKLREIEEREIERTGITSLKIAFNNVFGYYLEVRNTHKDKVPSDWIRKQTLTQAERYITEELKDYETKILGAEEKIYAIEQRLFQQLLLDVMPYLTDIQFNALRIAEVDVLTCFAFNALTYHYTEPTVSEDDVLEIKEGRHPVIERLLPTGEQYISNDLLLDANTQQIMMITGPNMSGKSALLRQTALIVLMAQMGSFVPASAAKIGLVDKIFTRVGASDNLSGGESTFMVEMNETASILNQMTGRSLILMDEIGRGTSTYDGISIAWAIAEYLHEHPNHHPKTLFATHYHELNEMTHRFKRIRNFNVAVKEEKGHVLFLRKLVEGGSNHSFGIHVAQLAGMPTSVTQRAKQLLKDLEAQRGDHQETKEVLAQAPQLAIFEMEDPQWNKIKQEVLTLDVNNMTPIEALNFIANLKKEAQKS